MGWTVLRQLTALADELPRYADNLKHKIADLRGASQGALMTKVQTTVQEVLGVLEKEESRTVGGPQRAPAEQPVPVVVQGPSALWQLPSVLEPLAAAGLVLVLPSSCSSSARTCGTVSSASWAAGA